MITGEKNRAHNCLTVSNLKLDDVFSDIYGKSSRSITEQILQHPRETFDVSPFVDGRCKTPIEEIQAAVDGTISKEQATKLRQYLNHIDELEIHKAEIEREIFRLSDKYECVLNLIRTVPGFDKNPLTAIWNIFTDLKPYTSDGFLEARSVNKEKVLTISLALNLLKQRGYIIKNDVVPVT